MLLIEMLHIHERVAYCEESIKKLRDRLSALETERVHYYQHEPINTRPMRITCVAS